MILTPERALKLLDAVLADEAPETLPYCRIEAHGNLNTVTFSLRQYLSGSSHVLGRAKLGEEGNRVAQVLLDALHQRQSAKKPAGMQKKRAPAGARGVGA